MTVDEFIAMTGWDAPEPIARIGMANALRWFEANFTPAELQAPPKYTSVYAGRVQSELVQMMQSISFLSPVDAGARVIEGTPLIRYGRPGEPWGQYFTTPGTPAAHVAIARGQRARFQFRAKKTFQCLKTRASDAFLYWRPGAHVRYSGGGGEQFFIRRPEEVLALVTPGTA
jgi:hypothetical protein